MLRARAFTALAWTTHPTRDTSANNFRCTSGPRRKSADTIGNWRCSSKRPGSARFCSTRTCRSSTKTKPRRFAELARCRPAQNACCDSFVARSALDTGPIAVAGDLAEKVASHPALVSQGGHPLWRTNITICLVEAERYDVADRMLSRAIRHAERVGSPQWLARALVAARPGAGIACGDLRAAEADGARQSISMDGRRLHQDAGSRRGRRFVGRPGPSRRGRKFCSPNGAWTANSRPTLFSVLPLACARAMPRRHGGLRPSPADLEDVLRRIELSRGLFPWASDARVALVPVLLRDGSRSTGARGGRSRVCRGDVRGISAQDRCSAARFADCWRAASDGVDLLRQAAEILAQSPALLWRAEAYVDFGTAMRADGQVISSRDILREGMELAHRCGATPLADRAEKELRAAGGRPEEAGGYRRRRADRQRAARRGVGGGRPSNKEIAQSLFVTLRTVELHLSNAYGKLQIRSRHELAAALG